MAIFRIQENQKIMMAYIYEVDADTKEEAIRIYEEELAGSLPVMDEYPSDSTKEEIKIED